MAVTNENSDLMALVVQNKLAPKSKVTDDGKVFFTFTQGAAAGDANSTIRLYQAKPGWRFNPYLSRLKWAAFGASRVLSLGWEAYTEPDGTVVAADPDGLSAGLDVSAAGQSTVDASPTTVVHDKLFKGEAVIVAQVTGGTIPAATLVRGCLVFNLGTTGE